MDKLIIFILIFCCCCLSLLSSGTYYFLSNKSSLPNNQVSLLAINQGSLEETTITQPPTTTKIPMLYEFKSHTFTTAGKSGPIGPTLADVKQAYSSVNWAQNNEFLDMTKQGIQEWKVPVTGEYTIRAVGAKGGDSLDGNKGGKGIDITTSTILNKGEIIKILVGQKGQDEAPPLDKTINIWNRPIGGGGGTFVVRDIKTPIIVAGGGGGATSSTNFVTYNGSKGGKDANSTTNGGGSPIALTVNGNRLISGENGYGATIITSADIGTGYGFGGQGGGLLSNGDFDQRGPAGKGFVNGGIGGYKYGGFGGGACGWTAGLSFNDGSSHGGGGAGGYSGGIGAVNSINDNKKNFYSAGGGGSYAISKMIINGFNNGDGYVTITLIKQESSLPNNQESSQQSTTKIPMLYEFKSHTFTTAGKIGPIGPTLSEVKEAYSSVSWAQNSEFLNMTKQGIQEWKVPATGEYTIQAVGAAGGDSVDGAKGGNGIDLSITTTLNKDEIIKILVGQKGISGNSNKISDPPGGGGGTFVVRDIKTPIIVAGGGGGASSYGRYSSFSGNKNGGNGVITTKGGGGGSNGITSNMIAKPGVDGNGGITSSETYGNAVSCPGGGLLSNGVFYNTSQQVGIGFVNGGLGGGNTGGFGGGAGGWPDSESSGGGAGGYSGGAGSMFDGNSNGFPFFTAGGGGSYSITGKFNSAAAYNDGDGSVIITLIN
jgi:hypothetical protein